MITYTKSPPPTGVAIASSLLPLSTNSAILLLGHRWKRSPQFLKWQTTTPTSLWLRLSSGALRSCAWLSGPRALVYRPAREATPSWVTSLICLLLKSGSNLVPGVNSMVSTLRFSPHTIHTLTWTLTHWTLYASGDVTHINVLGQDTIILNSSKAAFDLLDKRSATYSNRPILMMGGETVGWNRSLALTQYGPRFREYRKFMSKFVGTRASMEVFAPLQEKETAKFLVRVMADPGSLIQQTRK